jgi:hypothetical protein
MATYSPSTGYRIGLVALVILAVILLGVLTRPDHRNAAQRMGDAIEQLPDVSRAADQLGDRSPGERLGDAVEDAGETIRDASDTP